MGNEFRTSMPHQVEIDQLLEQFKDPEQEDHIMLSSAVARDILLNKLLDFYRSIKEGVREPTDPKIEVLAAIAVNKNQGELLDYTEMLKEFTRGRNEEYEEEEDRTSLINLVIPRETRRNR